MRELFDKEVKKGAYHIASNKFYGPIEGYEFKTDRLVREHVKCNALVVSSVGRR